MCFLSDGTEIDNRDFHVILELVLSLAGWGNRSGKMSNLPEGTQLAATIAVQFTPIF